jgi:glycosyltransferase involved in cell wall biosynthesis
VIDDASTDESPDILRKWKEKRPDWHFVFQMENQGNCKTFNRLLSKAKGDWILDFATDDVLLPDGLEGWIQRAVAKKDTGFCYADAWIFGDSGVEDKRFSTTLNQPFPEGKILFDLLNKTFICPPAVLFNREKLISMGGYDETLAFEDWDIWLRMARNFHIAHHPEPVIRYRKHSASLSASMVLKRNQKLLDSTHQILTRVSEWAEIKAEPKVLTAFSRYHLRLSFYLQRPEQAQKFYRFMVIQGIQSRTDVLLAFFSGRLPFVYPLYRFYQGIRKIGKGG